MRTREDPAGRPSVGVPTGPIGGIAIKNRDLSIFRIVFLTNNISVWGWPSRGGLIVLQHATALDFDFLGLDHINPPMHRASDQTLEDEFCQRLLMLGATWYDSRDRYGFVWDVAEDNEPDIFALENGEAHSPTSMERRWVSVGYPSDSRGFWVAEYETQMWGMREKYNLLPQEAVRVTLAKTMDMKCEILKSMGAKYFASLEDYDGLGCLRAWEDKTEGEFGPLVRTTYRKEEII